MNCAVWSRLSPPIMTRLKISNELSNLLMYVFDCHFSSFLSLFLLYFVEQRITSLTWKDRDCLTSASFTSLFLFLLLLFLLLVWNDRFCLLWFSSRSGCSASFHFLLSVVCEDCDSWQDSLAWNQPCHAPKQEDWVQHVRHRSVHCQIWYASLWLESDAALQGQSETLASLSLYVCA